MSELMQDTSLGVVAITAFLVVLLARAPDIAVGQWLNLGIFSKWLTLFSNDVLLVVGLPLAIYASSQISDGVLAGAVIGEALVVVSLGLSYWLKGAGSVVADSIGLIGRYIGYAVSFTLIPRLLQIDPALPDAPTAWTILDGGIGAVYNGLLLPAGQTLTSAVGITADDIPTYLTSLSIAVLSGLITNFIRGSLGTARKANAPQSA